MKFTLDAEGGGTLLIDFEREWNGANGHILSLVTLACWAELLRYTNIVDVVEANVWVGITGEPTPCPVTGENVWTEPWFMCARREEVREAEAARALEDEDPDDPRSPQLRSALAAFHALPRDENGKCAVDRAGESACDRLGLPRGDETYSVLRGASLQCCPEVRCDGEALFSPEERAELAALLEPHMGTVRRHHRTFVHSLTSRVEDPLAEPEDARPTMKDLTQDIYARYGVEERQDHAA